MTRILTVNDVRSLIKKVGLHTFFSKLQAQLTEDFGRWHDFANYPRHVTHYPHGVMELMPTSTEDYFAFKFVNGHPNNPLQKKLTVAAVGLLADVKTGYPQLFCEMTLLTAFRTAAVAALAARYLANPNPSKVAIIGTGAQSEFQAIALMLAVGCTHINYYDIDPQAMDKFAHNLQNSGLSLKPCFGINEAVKDCSIITTATAAKKQNIILSNDNVHPGVHINALGGDCQGKTELDIAILERSRIVVELLKQTRQEGEIQNINNIPIYAELWEIICGQKPGRTSSQQITLFDSVGLALEDYSVLQLVFELATEYNIGSELNMIPQLEDPKDLFSLLE